MRNILMFLLLLTSAIFAVATNPEREFRFLPDAFFPEHFRTDMHFDTSYTLSLVDGGMASGDPTNIRAGDTVCSGSTLRVTPTVTSLWATDSMDFDIYCDYPFCEAPDPCPSMITFTDVTTDLPIEWLDGSAGGNFESQWANAEGDPTSHETAFYDDLGTFHNQRVTYTISEFLPDEFNKRGGANIFCAGDLVIGDLAGGISERQDVHSLATYDYVVTGAGAHTIGTELQDVECFGAVVKHELEPLFTFYYFIYADPLPSPMGGHSMTINVAESGGTCSFSVVTDSEGNPDVTASEELEAADRVQVTVRVHNDGDDLILRDVSAVLPSGADDPDFTAYPFRRYCEDMFFPPGICEPDGFESPGEPDGTDEILASGREMDVDVLLVREAGATGGTILNLEGESASGACGGASGCDLQVDLRGAVWCEIEPPSFEYGPYEVAEFLVTCYNLAGGEVACDGNNWYWADGISGDFIRRTSSYAWAYPTSSIGAEGRLWYESGEGIAECFSDIRLVEPTYECEFLPPEAEMDPEEYEYFILNCFEDGSSSTPDDAEYDLTDGLDGSLSDSDTDGTGYTAPDDTTSGNLRGFGYWADSSDDPLLGAVAIAPIDVNTSNATIIDVGGDEGEGPSEDCTIGDGPLTVYPGFRGWVPIRCGPLANETCSGVSWRITGGTPEPPSDNEGTWFEIPLDAPPGSNGLISAVLGDPADGRRCSLPFYIGERDCWEFS